MFAIGNARHFAFRVHNDLFGIVAVSDSAPVKRSFYTFIKGFLMVFYGVPKFWVLVFPAMEGLYTYLKEISYFDVGSAEIA